MAWFAIRTSPGAQMPQREIIRERTYDENGHETKVGRLITSLNPNISAVERKLKDAGFTYYMPVQRKVVRDRRKTNSWTTRRFPLLQGYVFVRDVVDFPRLEDTPGVAGIVGTNGRPLHVPDGDILVMQDEEAKDAARAEKILADYRERAQRLTHSKARVKFPKGSTVAVKTGLFVGREARVVASGRDGRLKAIVEGLDAVGLVSLPLADVVLIEAA